MRLLKIPRNGRIDETLVSKCEMTEQVIKATKAMYSKTGYEEPWIGYLAFKNNQCIGACAFKAAPFANKVEIAYFTFPEYQGKGFASRMAQALVEIARAENPNLIIVAQTQPQESASNSILKKMGFEFAREVMHPKDGEVWEWHLKPFQERHLS